LRRTCGGCWPPTPLPPPPHATNGLMEFLIVRTLAWARERESTELSLNFCALTDLVSPERAATRPRRLARRALLAADRAFQLERLYVFDKKFFPEWRPRYLCLERLTDLPVVGLAYLHVEQLLVPPRPWAARAGRGRGTVR
jgi:lysyl-tRNA synthetase, class II